MEWSSIISLSDLTPRQQEMAEVIGLDAYISLTQYFGGESPYIPQFGELVKDPRNKELRGKYDGYNIIPLAREYRLSERYVRLLTSDLRKARQAAPIANQLSFDELK